MAAPIVRSALDVRNITNPYRVGMFGRGYNSYGGFGGYGQYGYAGRGWFGPRAAGGYLQRPGFGGAIGHAFLNLPGMLAKNALLAGLLSLISNGADLIGGKVDAKQFLAHTVADTAAYTGIGVSATMVGGMIGSLVPGIGTLVGILAGAAVSFFLGKLYEDQLRPGFTKTMETKMLGASQATLQPVPNQPQQQWQPAPAWPATAR
jgi:hypothetical protein